MSEKGVVKKVVKKDKLKSNSKEKPKVDIKGKVDSKKKENFAVMVAVISFILLILIAIGAGAWFLLKNTSINLDYSHINLTNISQSEAKSYILEANGNITNYEIDANLGMKMGFATDIFENLAPSIGASANMGEVSAVEMVYD